MLSFKGPEIDKVRETDHFFLRLLIIDYYQAALLYFLLEYIVLEYIALTCTHMRFLPLQTVPFTFDSVAAA